MNEGKISLVRKIFPNSSTRRRDLLKKQSVKIWIYVLTMARPAKMQKGRIFSICSILMPLHFSTTPIYAAICCVRKLRRFVKHLNVCCCNICS